MCIIQGALDFKDNTLTLLWGHWSEREGEKVREGRQSKRCIPLTPY